MSVLIRFRPAGRAAGRSSLPVRQTASFRARLTVIPDPGVARPTREDVRLAEADFFEMFQVPFRYQGQQTFDAVFVRGARAAGRPVQAWVIDEVDDMRQLMSWGTTGIISDRPDIAVEEVRRWMREHRSDPGS